MKVESKTDLSFSIVIPTRNEAEDIAATLEFAGHQSLPVNGIIVVDDSDDATPRIVQQMQSRLPCIRLLLGNRTGRTGARNQGILACQSDVVVILNADVHLPPDFLERLRPHYLAGAGYVLVGWRVANRESAVARFVEAQSYMQLQSDDSIEWTEGFSCRRDLAMRAGLFPMTPVPLVAGEDGPFGAALHRIGRKVVDRSIVVSFVAPVQLGLFWQTYKERVYPHTHYFLFHRSIKHIVLRTIAKQIKRLLEILLIVPVLVYSWRVCRWSSRGRRDWPWFVLTDVFQKLAFIVGEWEGLIRLVLRLRHLPESALNAPERPHVE